MITEPQDVYTEISAAANALINFKGDVSIPINCSLIAISMVLMRNGLSYDGLADRLRLMADMVDDLPTTRGTIQ